MKNIMMTEKRLIKTAISYACNKAPHNKTQRAVVSELFNVNAETAERVCWKYGFHPDKIAKIN
jgi:N-acyl-L-homoserine lactone synthetase